MVATSLQIMHEQNFKAKHEVEVTVGVDNIVRINIDGVCAIRVRMEKGCVFQLVPGTEDRALTMTECDLACLQFTV